MSRALSVVLLAVCFGVAGCAGDGGKETATAPAPTVTVTVSSSPAVPGSPTVSGSPSASAGPSAPGILTEKDSGRTVTLHGNAVNVRLSNEWVWQEPRVQGGAVQLNQVNYVVDPGYTEWVANPVRAGTSTVNIQGLPKQTGPGKNQGPLDVTYTFNVN